MSTSAASLSPEQQRLADEHDDGGVTTETTQRTAAGVSKKKPHRPCIFCGQLKSDITAHLITVHKNEDQIIEIQTMDKRPRLQALAKLRKQGIAKRNVAIIAEGGESTELMCQRKCEGSKVICSICGGVYKKIFFYRHVKVCRTPKKTTVPQAVTTQASVTTNNPPTEWEVVVNSMDRDHIYDIIKSDDLIMQIGKDIYDSRKPAKEKDGKNKARTSMRRLARLVEATEGVTKCEELFDVSHFYRFEQGIHNVCEADAGSDKESKSGLKVSLGSLIRLAAKSVIANFIITNRINDSNQVERFLKVFNMNYSKIFSRAEYQLKENRQRQNRKPSALPDEQHLEKLRVYLIKEIDEAVKRTGPLTKVMYVHLRKVTVTRLTILNARRGSEPARLQLKDFKERHEWITPGMSKELTSKYAITYLMGKGDKLVPVLLPRECEKAMVMLADCANRAHAGISPKNDFVFAYTQQSLDSCTGYNEIMDVCNQIDIPVITATSVRHRTSTLFWKMEGIEESTIDTFMLHLGHERSINQNIYAVPPSERIFQTVVPLIEELDQVHIYNLYHFAGSFLFSQFAKLFQTVIWSLTCSYLLLFSNLFLQNSYFN